MQGRKLVIVAAILGLTAAAPSAASAAESGDASCAGQFATSVDGGPIKGDFASANASGDGHNFGTVTSTAFAQCPERP